MKKKNFGWSVKQVKSMMDKKRITFDSPLQREPGQWEKENKSELIDSLITMFIPPVIAVQDGEAYDVIDGLQRLTNIYDFINNKYSLMENAEPITLTETTGETFPVAGQQFWQLPESLQDAILGANLTFWVAEIEENDDEEEVITKLFKRLNSGAVMAKGHLALVSANKQIQEFVHNMVTQNKLFTDVAHFSAGQLKKSDRHVAVMQSLIYLSGLEYKDFSAKEMEKYFITNTIPQETLDKAEKAFTLIADALNNEHNTFMQKVRLSPFAYVANKAIEQGQEEKFKQFVKSYVTTSTKNDPFRAKCGAGNTKKEKCIGRITALEQIFNEFEFIPSEFTFNTEVKPLPEQELIENSEAVPEESQEENIEAEVTA